MLRGPRTGLMIAHRVSCILRVLRTGLASSFIGVGIVDLERSISLNTRKKENQI